MTSFSSDDYPDDNYPEDEEKNVKAYIEYLERPDTILIQDERNKGLLALGKDLFYRYTGEFVDMPDDLRFKRLIAYNKKQCNLPLSKQKVLEIIESIKRNHTADRAEKRDKREEDNEFIENKIKGKYKTKSNLTPFGTIDELNGNTYYQTNNKPAKCIVAEKRTRRLIEVVIKTKTNESTTSGGNTKNVTYKQTVHTTPFLANIPQKVIIHKSPIEHIIKRSADKYTIHFIGAEKSGCRIIKHKTISEIVTELKESGNVMAEFGVDIALSMILKEFERRQLVEENMDIDLTGFFIDDKGQLIASGIDNIDVLPSKGEFLDALKAIEELKKYYENRLDLLATTIMWGMIAPFSFRT